MDFAGPDFVDINDLDWPTQERQTLYSFEASVWGQVYAQVNDTVFELDQIRFQIGPHDIG